MQHDAIRQIYRHIGKRIEELRTLRGSKMTQRDLAKEVGLSRASVANIESGRHRVQIHVLYGLARALGVSPYDLLPDPSSTEALPASFTDQLRPRERAAVARLLSSSKETNDA